MKVAIDLLVQVPLPSLPSSLPPFLPPSVRLGLPPSSSQPLLSLLSSARSCRSSFFSPFPAP
jgi:hypothetical protein